MTKQLFIGLYTEGNTDKRFLESVVKRTFDETALEAIGDFEIYLQSISIEKSGLGFVEQVLKAAKKGVDEFGITILCLHRDADHVDDSLVFEHSINPAIQALSEKNEPENCKIITVIAPVQMIEAWLLADKELFKKEIGTIKSDNELGISRFPERIANPKDVIKEAIRIARQDMVKRRRRDLTITELYMPLGQKISIENLNALPSYIKFRESVRTVFKTLNYLQ